MPCLNERDGCSYSARPEAQIARPQSFALRQPTHLLRDKVENLFGLEVKVLLVSNRRPSELLCLWTEANCRTAARVLDQRFAFSALIKNIVRVHSRLDLVRVKSI